jgi:chemotaxis protein CheD
LRLGGPEPLARNRRQRLAQPPLFDERTGASLPHIFLYPGTLCCTAEPSVVTTVLGSCVAVCLTDRSRRFSGINHYMLPRGDTDKSSLRHGESAISMLLQEMRSLGCRVDDMKAKIFGGAAVLPVTNPEDAVGAKNVAVAIKYLRTLDIDIVARRTGGKSGMLVRLFTATGEVLVRQVASTVEWSGDELPFEQGRRLRA